MFPQILFTVVVAVGLFQYGESRHQIPLRVLNENYNLNSEKGRQEETNLNDKISDEIFNINVAGIEDQIKFFLYTRLNTDTYQQLLVNDVTSVKNSYINFNYPTTFIVHGYFDSITSDIIQSIKNGLLARESHNVVGVDWSAIADTLIYSNAAGSVPEVGEYTSQLIEFLVEQGLSVERLHLIGHSLGAHVVGLAGRNFSLSNGNKIARITGLDPAKPGFFTADASGRLDASDAVFVDCIHTCSGELGLGKPVCTSDYYPDGSKGYQPGCPLWDIAGVCSHARSYEYYAESIQLSHKFKAMQCQSVPQDSTASNCVESGALMGDPATSGFKGTYLVLTNSASPYAQDISS